MTRAASTFVAACIVASPLIGFGASADRAVVWTVAGEAALERELNAQAARGLRVAAVSEGLPCTLTAMQAPELALPPAAYRVVADRDLDAMLGSLVADGFTPRLPHRRALGGRAHVIFERSNSERPSATWRLIEFPDLDALPSVLAAAASEGFQARLLVRYPFKSWPGLSEKGLILASKSGAGKARETQVVGGQSRNIDAAARAIADATAQGFSLDMLFTGSRDGSRDTRRERLRVVLSREVGAAPTSRPVRLERTSSFGTFGSGVPLGVAPYWDDDYVYAWSPAERRQTWASPIRLSAEEAGCGGLSFKMRFDAPRDHAWTIVGLVAKKLSTGGYELVYVTDQRLGG